MKKTPLRSRFRAGFFATTGLWFAALTMIGCASVQTAKQFSYISYEEKPTPSKSIGTIEGRDCSWSIAGYSLGQPTLRSAFSNAASQSKEGYIPGQTGDKKGPSLKSVRQVTVENDGFNAWIVGRTCIIVTGEGYL